MRVYKVIGYPKYGAALAIVAANDPRQAEALTRAIDSGWSNYVNRITTICMHGVTSNASRPRVLTETSYIE